MQEYDLGEFVRSGVAVTVATRDADLRPALTRGWGLELSDDRGTLTLCVAAPPGSRARENLERTGAIAVGVSPPTIARAAQLKGSVVALREPSRDELERAVRHVSLFADEVEQIGLPGQVALRMHVAADLVAVTVAVDEIFDQTPGPAAGRPL